MTAATEHLNKAAAHEAEAAASFERCDTDGFVSQWASGIMADKERLAARIIEDGGLATFPALFRGDTLVPAVLLETRFGTKWGVFASAADANRYGANIIEWVPFRGSDKKGYTLGWVKRPARATIKGRGRGLSGSAWAAAEVIGDRFDPNAEVVFTDLRGNVEGI